MITITLTRIRLTWIAAAIAAVIAAVFVAGCSPSSKITQPFQDAPVSGMLKGPAEIGTMPDGFNNFAEKCDDHGNRVFVIFHSDGAYGSVFAMKDPTCGTGR